MNIRWNIDKKRGNYRPTLKYVISLEEHERAIAMQSIQIESLIPRIPEPGKGWCMPGENERAEGWQPKEFHYLSVPWFKTGQHSDFLYLPFRDSGDYPEVEESFVLLRQRYEEVVRKTYRWEPIKQSGELETSPETKKAIAARLAAMQMLSFGSVK
ncbi:MAG: hypothetical protein CSA20_04180 [Deltaproteobacteria bacterium]|nr:MAG: hypothetical protein CSB23_01570 [Deltaproteobacteria bacterium]PIE73286.1 MAG: hypothetical protein CSA20_04180 [Deltaproteobacteria bacterium]